ncbi:hypothetical protein KST07_02465 [Fusobacterium nucleatum]|jgi:hypothetical protein|uniref:hypothetical protein n=1 Tax=Fusobacterium nucleatum TaxID=851 RepID=UPI0030CF28E0
MLLFTADYLKSKCEQITYEFENVDNYINLCKKYQTDDTSVICNESFNLLNELTIDLAIFKYKEVYIFFKIKKIEDAEVLYIYDYIDLDYKIKDTKENFAKVKSQDLYKLLLFQLGKI